jgi:hypothetical protein
MSMKILRTLAAASAMFGAVASLPLFAQTEQEPLAVTRIVKPIDENHLIALPGNIHPLAQARTDQGPAGRFGPRDRRQRDPHPARSLAETAGSLLKSNEMFA